MTAVSSVRAGAEAKRDKVFHKGATTSFSSAIPAPTEAKARQGSIGKTEARQTPAAPAPIDSVSNTRGDSQPRMVARKLNPLCAGPCE